MKVNRIFDTEQLQVGDSLIVGVFKEKLNVEFIHSKFVVLCDNGYFYDLRTHKVIKK